MFEALFEKYDDFRPHLDELEDEQIEEVIEKITHLIGS